MQHDGGHHPLADVPQDGDEHGGAVQPGQLLHLGQVLVGKTDGIEAGGVQQRAAVRGLVLGDHLLAPAGVAGEREAGDGIVPGQYPQLDQGGGGGQKAGGVAAGVGHPAGELDALALAGQQLGKAVHPALGGAVGGGGVDDPGLGVVDQRDRLFGGGVRQAEEDQVGLV